MSDEDVIGLIRSLPVSEQLRMRAFWEGQRIARENSAAQPPLPLLNPGGKRSPKPQRKFHTAVAILQAQYGER